MCKTTPRLMSEVCGFVVNIAIMLHLIQGNSWLKWLFLNTIFIIKNSLRNYASSYCIQPEFDFFFFYIGFKFRKTQNASSSRRLTIYFKVQPAISIIHRTYVHFAY